MGVVRPAGAAGSGGGGARQGKPSIGAGRHWEHAFAAAHQRHAIGLAVALIAIT